MLSPAQPDLSEVPPAPRSVSSLARELILKPYGESGRLSGKRGVRLFVGLMFLTVGMLPVALFGWDLWRDFAIDLNGKTVQGKVLEARLNTSMSINKRNPTTARFQYWVDGKAYEAETDVLHPKFGEVGSEISVEYASNTPAYARIAGHTACPLGYAALLFLIMPLTGAALIFSAIRANRGGGFHEILTRGTPILADVTSTKVLGIDKSRKKPSFVVQWSFQVRGERYTGMLFSLDPTQYRELERLASSGKVVVLYLPENPQENTLWIA